MILKWTKQQSIKLVRIIFWYKCWQSNTFLMFNKGQLMDKTYMVFFWSIFHKTIDIKSKDRTILTGNPALEGTGYVLNKNFQKIKLNYLLWGLFTWPNEYDQNFLNMSDFMTVVVSWAMVYCNNLATYAYKFLGVS